MIPVLVLAAGQSSRMRGADKLLEPVAGQPLLRRLAQAALDAGLAPWIALPAPDHPRVRALEGLACHPLFLPGSAEGMGGTLRDGVAALPPCPRFLIMAADLPGLTSADLARMAAETTGLIERGIEDGTFRPAPVAAIAAVLSAPAVQLARRRALGGTDPAVVEAVFSLAWRGVAFR